jgi:hypothetical protein
MTPTITRYRLPITEQGYPHRRWMLSVRVDESIFTEELISLFGEVGGPHIRLSRVEVHLFAQAIACRKAAQILKTITLAHTQLLFGESEACHQESGEPTYQKAGLAIWLLNQSELKVS